MEFIDLKSQQRRIRDRIDQRIKQVLDHGAYILGPEVSELESALARYVDTPHCLSCANGTDALLIPLMAWGVGSGDGVLVPSFTFFATAEVVSLAGATPVFVDIDPRTFNIDPADLERALQQGIAKGLRMRGIIPVNLFGQMADYDAICAFAKKHNLFILEDAAQSFGARWKSKASGSLGDASATSFFPAKPLGCYGDGGAIFCSDTPLMETMKSIRVHGQGTDRYENVRIGMNGRLDTIQAAILLEKLVIFDDEIISRQRIASRYSEALSKRFITPLVHQNSTSVWAQYSLLTEKRDEVVAHLKKNDIPVMIYYPTPLHLQKAYLSLGYKPGDLPSSERAAKSIFSIPMHPYLSESDQERIIDSLLSF